MDRYVLLCEKEWHLGLFEKLKENFPDDEWILIQNKQDFKNEKLSIIKPKTIFIPHWSNFISRHIFLNYKCILFHMTDLPYGRGGSPLQNLIINGHEQTKISAIKVTDGIDEGPIYLKKKLDLSGSAKDIFSRSSNIIFQMICMIIDENIIPVPQKGESTIFKRRNPKQSDISKLDDLNIIYDYIRMLDCDGYPNAFIDLNGVRYEFSNVKNLKNSLEANVRIIKN